MRTLSQRFLTAFHEAGHAVAVLRRNGTIAAIAIEPEPGGIHYGATDRVGPTWADPFIAYAGLFAEARVQWLDIDISDTDDDGRSTYSIFPRIEPPDCPIGRYVMRQNDDHSMLIRPATVAIAACLISSLNFAISWAERARLCPPSSRTAAALVADNTRLRCNS
jgi:hypothetical protein